MKDFKESLTSDPPDETRQSINKDLVPVIRDQEKTLAEDLKKISEQNQLKAVHEMLCDIQHFRGARTLAKRLAADTDGFLAKQLFGEGGVPQHLKPWVEVANSSRPFLEDRCKWKFGEALLERKAKLETSVDKSLRPDMPHLDTMVQGLKDYIAAVKRVEAANEELHKAMEAERDYYHPDSSKTR